MGRLGLICLIALLVVGATGCGAEPRGPAMPTPTSPGKEAKVFRSEGGGVAVTVQPFYGLVQGDTVTFRVEVENQHQIYLTTILLEPDKSVWYRWPPVILYSEGHEWPEYIVAQEGGWDVAEVKARIPEQLKGPLEVKLHINFTFPHYRSYIGKYSAEWGGAVVSIPLNLPTKEGSDKEPWLQLGVGAPLRFSAGSTLSVDEIRTIGSKAFLRLSLDNSQSKRWTKPKELRLRLIDKAGIEAPRFHLFSLPDREAYPRFEVAKGEIAQGWIAYDVGEVRQELFLYFWDRTMDTMAFIYLGEVKAVAASQLFHVETWKLIQDDGRPAFEIRSVQAHDSKVSLLNPEGRWVAAVELSVGEAVWQIPIEAEGIGEREPALMVGGTYTLVAEESHTGVKLNSETRQFDGAKLTMIDASLSVKFDKPYVLSSTGFSWELTAKLSNSGDLPVYIERVDAILDGGLSIRDSAFLSFRPELYIFPGEEITLQKLCSFPECSTAIGLFELESHLTPGSKRVTLTVVPANFEPAAQVIEFEGPTLSVEHAEVSWFYSRLDNAYSTVKLKIKIRNSGDLPCYFETVRVTVDGKSSGPVPGVYVMPRQSWSFDGSLSISGIEPGDKVLSIEVLGADGTVLHSYTEHIHVGN